jgi:hypothetical protein
LTTEYYTVETEETSHAPGRVYAAGNDDTHV